MLAHNMIKRKLAHRVGTEWPPGSRLPTVNELARELGAGVVNTHRAIKQLSEKGLLVSRRGIGTFVSDSLEPATLQAERSDANGPDRGFLQGRRIAVVFGSDQPDLFLWQIFKAFSDAIEKHGAVVSQHLVTSLLKRDKALDAADAQVYLNPPTRLNYARQPGQAVLIITTSIIAPIGLVGGYDLVSIDQEHGGYLAGHALRGAGVQRPCFVGAPESVDSTEYNPTSAARLHGFQSAFDQPVSATNLLFCAHHDIPSGAAAAAHFIQLGERPDGVFAASDEIAIGLILGLLSHGLEPGRDYKIVGFDAQAISRVTCPKPLTTVAVPTQTMGERGAAMLIDRLASPEQPVRRLALGCELVPGGTLSPKRMNHPASQLLAPFVYDRAHTRY